MIRFVLIMAVVFALPFIAWKIAAAFRSGKPATMPVGMLSMIGGGLAATSMVVLAALSIEGSNRDGIYQPSRLQDGEVRPSGFEPSEPDSGSDQPSLW